MSLYIRLYTNFWTHRKTVRLRAAIGDAAFWVPPRLWSYAAENQPDGDFSDYSAKEIALLVGYEGDASSMLKALQQACFMDDKKLHEWKEHNDYHATFSKRAKKAAKSRWESKPSPTPSPGEEKRRQEPSIPSSMLGASAETQKFKDYWLSFPRNRGTRSKAWKLWCELGCEAIADKVIESVKAHAMDPDWTKNNGQYIPGGDTFLSERKWENKLKIETPKSSGPTGIFAPGGERDLTKFT